MGFTSSTSSGELYDMPQKQKITRSLLRNFIDDPSIASIAPSSTSVANTICNQIDFSHAINIVEYGPGKGAITKHILASMNANSNLYAIDTNSECINSLAMDFQDIRLHIIEGNAADANKLIHKQDFLADVIISGIPFSFFTPEMSLDILKNTALLLKANGLFITYQTWIPPFITPHKLKSLMDPYFKMSSIHDIYMNLPPLRIMVAKPRAFRTKDKSAIYDDRMTQSPSIFELNSNQKRIYHHGSSSK